MTGEGEATPGSQWVSIRGAAGILGVSERTIRRRVRSGTLQSDDNGPILLVDVSGERQAQRQAVPGKGTGGAGQPALELCPGELALLRLRVALLTGQLEEAQRDKDRWRFQAEAVLVNQRLLLGDGRRKGWRWPWEKER
jgi:hypothetical protein